jgi:hypothetical protein
MMREERKEGRKEGRKGDYEVEQLSTYNTTHCEMESFSECYILCSIEV